MAVRFYITPKEGDGFETSPFLPKYFTANGVTRWQAMDFGRDDSFLVGADVDATQHAALVAETDVTVVPLNIDNQIGDALTQVTNALESVRIPAGWVTSAHTYRQVIGFAGRLSLLWQRFEGRWNRSFYESGITLGTQMNELTVGQRNALEEVIVSLGALQRVSYDLSSVEGSTTIRQVIKIVADQAPSFTLAGQVF